MQTRLRRVSWKLIINLYCHSNIIVNLNRRHIFNATFQINVRRPMVRFFFSSFFCFHHPSLLSAHFSIVLTTFTWLYFRLHWSPKICTPKIKAIAMIFRSTNYFIYFIRLRIVTINLTGMHSLSFPSLPIALHIHFDWLILATELFPIFRIIMMENSNIRRWFENEVKIWNIQRWWRS